MSPKSEGRFSEKGHATEKGGRPTVTSEARIFRVETSFQQMARRPGGISRDRAIERAETEIAEIKVEFDESLNRELTELATAFAAARDRPHDPERLADLAGRSRQLCDVTATMRFELLSFIAASLCELLESINAETVPTRADRLSSRLVEPRSTTEFSRVAAGASSRTHQGAAPSRQTRQHVALRAARPDGIVVHLGKSPA